MKTYTCPYCGYKMPEDEADQTCDEGCPTSRCIIDWSDWDEPRDVSEMTKDLVKAEGWRMYYEVADQLTPYRTIKHI